MVGANVARATWKGKGVKKFFGSFFLEGGVDVSSVRAGWQRNVMGVGVVLV